MFIGTTQMLRCAGKACIDLFLNDAKQEEAIGEKLFGIRIDKNLTWNLHIDRWLTFADCRLHSGLA